MGDPDCCIDGDLRWLGVRFSRGGGPLAEVLPGLVAWLKEDGYAVTTSRNIVRAALRLGEWMAAAHLSLGDLDAGVITRLVERDNARFPSHRISNESLSAVVRFFLSAGLIEEPEECRGSLSVADRVLQQWCASLSSQGCGQLALQGAWLGGPISAFF